MAIAKLQNRRWRGMQNAVDDQDYATLADVKTRLSAIRSFMTVVAEMNDEITLVGQTDNHITRIVMGTWDTSLPYPITYNVKTDPQNGAILELHIDEDSFKAPAGPANVALTIKDGGSPIYVLSVVAGATLRLRYDSVEEAWFLIAYSFTSGESGGGSSVVSRGFNIGTGHTVVPVGLAPRGLVIDYACTIIGWTFVSTNITGSMTVDIIRANASIPSYPANSIIGGGTKPSLVSAKYSQSAPVGWTSVTLAAGDVLQLYINSNTAITAATLTLKLQL